MNEPEQHAQDAANCANDGASELILPLPAQWIHFAPSMTREGFGPRGHTDELPFGGLLQTVGNFYEANQSPWSLSKGDRITKMTAIVGHPARQRRRRREAGRD
jgi:hypothetical protein